MSTLAVEPLTVANAASGLPTLVAFPGTTREPEVKPPALVRPASELLKTQVPPWNYPGREPPFVAVKRPARP